MKIATIIFNILTILFATSFMLFTVFKGYGSPTGGGGASKLEWIIATVLVIVAVASVALTYLDTDRKLLWSLIVPLIYIGLMYITLGVVNAREQFSTNQHREQQHELIDKKIQNISQDYLPALTRDGSYEFITFDRDNNVLVYVIVAYDTVEAFPLGKVVDDTLQVLDKNYESKDPIGNIKYHNFDEFYNSDNKTIYENYSLAYKPNQDIKQYHLEKYQISEF